MKPLNYHNVQYGMLVRVHHDDGSYHAGCKVHFFNKKGVLVGNYYQFFSYEKLTYRGDYPRYFMNWSKSTGNLTIRERVKTWVFVGICKIVSGLLRFTQKFMD